MELQIKLAYRSENPDWPKILQIFSHIFPLKDGLLFENVT